MSKNVYKKDRIKLHELNNLGHKGLKYERNKKQRIKQVILNHCAAALLCAAKF